MRYPVMPSSEASVFLRQKREGESPSAEAFTRLRGEGEDIDEAFIVELQERLRKLREVYSDGLTNPRDANRFEAQAAQMVHRLVPAHPLLVADAEFWIWLAAARMSETVEWRYGHPDQGVPAANYGIGSRGENLLYRLWLRADIVFDVEEKNKYRLSECGQIDFYRSHLFRQGYANVRAFARALIRYQYPHSDPVKPRMKVEEIRELVKRLRRLRANLFLEILSEDVCREVIEREAMIVQQPM